MLSRLLIMYYYWLTMEDEEEEEEEEKQRINGLVTKRLSFFMCKEGRRGVGAAGYRHFCFVSSIWEQKDVCVGRVAFILSFYPGH
jgi:hypothetical protein